MRYLGAHVSVAGGVASAFERARKLRCGAFQLFVKNPSQWRGKPLADEEVERFRAAAARWTGAPPVAHAAYLINLAAPAGDVRRLSRTGLADELWRCDRLGVAGLVVHPGAHGGSGERVGLRRVAASLDAVLAERPAGGARVLLETTAGQGTCLGWRLEQLEAIIAQSRFPERLGVCLDTCHLFAAGYPVASAEGVAAMIAEAVARFGQERLACVHLNDSLRPAGSRRDRHANIGRGELGSAAFRHLLRVPELRSVPGIIETPDDDQRGHARDLRRLRRLLREARPRAQSALPPPTKPTASLTLGRHEDLAPPLRGAAGPYPHP